MYAAVICGGGTAGIEGLLRLHRLAGASVEVTLLGPEEYLFYRPDAVLAPFTSQPVHRYPIARIVADTGARWVRDRLAWVDPARGTVHTDGGEEIAYDALLLAVGGREREPVEHMDVFTDRSADAYRGILDGIEAGRITRMAYVRPRRPSWPVPLYELALLTAKRARDVGAQLEIAFITHERQPLRAFGADAGRAITKLLNDAGITLHTRADVTMLGPRHLVLEPSGVELHPDRTITLPTITGTNIRGIPGGALDRFVPVDEYCRVRHTDGRIFAAGDATDLPLKHGGIGAQQADTAAAGIAHLAGAAGPATALGPMIRGQLRTGGAPLYLEARLIAGGGFRTKLYDHPPWLPDEQLVAAELTPYLRRLRERASGADSTRQRPPP
jgi:sulfide:quinone oxidoreductase